MATNKPERAWPGQTTPLWGGQNFKYSNNRCNQEWLHHFKSGLNQFCERSQQNFCLFVPLIVTWCFEVTLVEFLFKCSLYRCTCTTQDPKLGTYPPGCAVHDRNYYLTATLGRLHEVAGTLRRGSRLLPGYPFQYSSDTRVWKCQKNPIGLLWSYTTHGDIQNVYIIIIIVIIIIIILQW